ncbi:MAG: oxidoreductase [Armatimonadetes bacterium]|nr:oxidoreductase [Armatimonadota bacterium]
MAAKPKIAIFKFSSCSGCQLVFLNCENELLDIAGALDIAYFVEAKRGGDPGPYDIGFVEGAITAPEEAERIKEVREQCKTLVAIGACACHGGIQSLKNWMKVEDLKKTVYEHPDKVSTLDWSTPVDMYVPIDAYLYGCPIDKDELLELVLSALIGRSPQLRPHAVCMECKLKGNPCLMISRKEACMGPVTRAGCAATCPSVGRACYGCHGPCNDPNVAGLARQFEGLGLSGPEIVRRLRQFTGYAEAFREVSKNYE